MPIINKPDYESLVKNKLNKHLLAPTGLHVLDNVLSFNKSLNATTYEIFIDNVSHGEVFLPGSGKTRYLLNEVLSIPDNQTARYAIDFESNGNTYDEIDINGRSTNWEGTNKFVMFYGETKVYEENDGTSSYWLNQSYRTIEYTDPPLYLDNFFRQNAVLENELITLDLSTLSTWGTLTDGTHTIYLIAKSTGYTASPESILISFGKNVEFIIGQIYGPYQCTRVVDGDTIIANINGVDSKIRMIGVNTPESVASSSYGTENCEEGIIASNYTKAQLTNAQIYVEFDTDIYDRYNRYLAYVYLNSEGTQMFNQQLITLGYGEAKYYSPNGAHRTYLENAQNNAKNSGEGFWEYGFFPTKLAPPVVTLNGNVISWAPNNYVSDYNIKRNGTIIANVIQIANNSNNNTYDLLQTITESGTYRINVVANPLRTTHEASNNSNNISFTR